MTQINIDNRIILFAAIAYFPVAWFSHVTLESIGGSLAFALAILLVCILIFLLGFMGGATGKLYATAALWLGPTAVFWWFAGTSLLLTAAVAALFVKFHPDGRQAHIPQAYVLLVTFAVAFPWSQIGVLVFS